jgi:hypothetical protein
MKVWGSGLAINSANENRVEVNIDCQIAGKKAIW